MAIHPLESGSSARAYIVTGPTSGIGLATAFELAKHGTVILVGRDREKLQAVQREIKRRGHNASVVPSDLADIGSVRAAAAQILSLRLPLAGLVNNAGVMQQRATQNRLGWDTTYATNHLGPFRSDRGSRSTPSRWSKRRVRRTAVEDPERKPAKAAGFRGARYISAEASARGEWKPGGSTVAGADAYATSKQGVLAAMSVTARETPRIHFNAVEPVFTPATSLGQRDVNPLVRVLVRILAPVLVPLLMPFMKFLSTPKRAAWLITKVVIDASGQSGVYYGESGQITQASEELQDVGFAERVVAETRALLATV